MPNVPAAADPTDSRAGRDPAAPSPVPPIVLPPRLVTATRREWREELGSRADAAVDLAAREENGEISLDLSATAELDVSGLGLLVVVRQRARDHGVGVRLLRVAPAVRELLAVTHLDALFRFDE